MRPSIPTRGLALGLLLLGNLPPALSAQAPPDTATAVRPYSQLRIRLSGARNVNREELHRFWSAGTGAALGLTTPFYVGSVGVGGTFIPFRTRDSSRPNFSALLLALDWGFELPVPGPLHARAAARIGDFVMLIENPDVWLDSESELFVGGELSAGVQLRRHLAVTAAGSFARVYTRPSLGLSFVTAGLEYATRTPGWVRAILE
jgi:hypothetical protein